MSLLSPVGSRTTRAIPCVFSPAAGMEKGGRQTNGQNNRQNTGQIEEEPLLFQKVGLLTKLTLYIQIWSSGRNKKKCFVLFKYYFYRLFYQILKLRISLADVLLLC